MKTTKLLAMSMAVCFGATSAFAQPVNDDCSGAISLTPGTILDACTIGSNVDATIETNEPAGNCWASAEDATVWYKFTVSNNGSYTITTDFADGNGADTQLQLFSTPTDCDSLALVACNDDAGICTALAAEITATLTAGTTYYIQVDLFDDVEGEFGIAVIDNSLSVASPNNDCYTGAFSLDFIQDSLDNHAFGCTDNYSYFNVSQEVITISGPTGPSYMGCNNNPQVPEFFGVWFEFTYDNTKPGGWLSVHASDLEKCDNNESEDIFYTLHLFKLAPNNGFSTCDDIIFNTGDAWCSVGDSDFSDATYGGKDKAGNSFYDHPRLDLSGLSNGTKYYVMVAQMTRYTVDYETVSDTVGYDPLGNPIIVETIVETKTIAAPDNGEFYLTYESANNLSNSSDLCTGSTTLTSTAITASNVGTQGNVQTSVYDGPLPIANEPLGYTGGNNGTGYYEDCNADSAFFTGGSVALENHNSAIYNFEVGPIQSDTLICTTKDDIKSDVEELIDILCPALVIYPGAFPDLYGPDGTILLSLGDSLENQFGPEIQILDSVTCELIKTIVLGLLDDPNIPNELCFVANCSPKTDIYLTDISACGNGFAGIYVLDNCDAGTVVIWSEIEDDATCVTLTSGATPLPEGTYYAVVDGGGKVLQYDISVVETYSYGAGGAPCSPDPFPGASVASSIEENATSFANLQLQPVPASDELHIQFDLNNAENNVNVNVIDMTGKQVMQTQQIGVSNGLNTHTIDVSSLTNGIYLLNIENNGDRVVSRFSIAK